MYITDLGGKPSGECFLTPPNKNNELYLTAHFYSGDNIKLIKFKGPAQTPEKNSTEQRLRNIENWQEQMTQYVNYMFRKLCSAADVKYESFESFKDSVTLPDDQGRDTSDTPYMVTNSDSWRGDR